MDKKEKILKRLKELADLIKQHNYNYHTLDKPKITDKEFDKFCLLYTSPSPRD